MDPIASTSPIDAATLRSMVGGATPSRPETLTALDMGQSVESGDTDAAVEQFRDIFLGFMVSAMRETVPESELLPKSSAEKMFESFLDQEYSTALGEQMGEDMITEALRRQLDPGADAREAKLNEIKERAESMAVPPPIAPQADQLVRKEEPVG